MGCACNSIGKVCTDDVRTCTTYTARVGLETFSLKIGEYVKLQKPCTEKKDTLVLTRPKIIYEPDDSYEQGSLGLYLHCISGIRMVSFSQHWYQRTEFDSQIILITVYSTRLTIL